MMKFKIPLLPLSAIVFYFLAVIFVQIGIFPQPDEAIKILENLYTSYGLIGLFVAAFFEGLVYVGLYFAGSFIILFVVLFSDGKLISFLSISVVVALALSLVSLVNYVLGRYIISKNLREKKELEKERKISSGLVLSALHPNSLAFYFFNLGLKKESPWKVIFIPLILIPYGFLLAYLFYQLKPILTKGAETPYILVTVLVIWFIIALILKNKNEI
ncbi:hypothetical protein J4422_03035 [Candidatus Pacearchaeota archaeon]|nr:hypothetical protein [Candidatus Pacearchaeota archaeon]